MAASDAMIEAGSDGVSGRTPGASRRGFLAGSAASIAVLSLSQGARAQEPVPTGFGFADVAKIARERAAEGHQSAGMTLRPPFADLSYDQYRAIRFREEARPLAGSDGAFALDLLPPGLVYRNMVDISIVRETGVERIPFSSSLFHFDPAHFDTEDGAAPSTDGDGLSFSGFRLRHPINSPDVMDEVAVFQGASYFRAVARSLIYGLSARGLAIATADPRGEEFPVFRRFWIHEPKPDQRHILVHALLESPSITGAFEFEIRPGETTVMETRCRLFPRSEVSQVGIAPLTSMYFFGPERRAGIDDFRDAVHDSSGLQMITGKGTRLWRPLSNHARVEISAFSDENPKGFGLTQRPRNFSYYQDAEARYDRRPSAWVEPLGAWGKGAVMLVEIPVENEFNDNIVAFWRPAAPLTPSEEGYDFAYRLHWCATPPDAAPLARVEATRIGESIHDDDERVVVVDFRRDAETPAALTPRLSTSAGEVSPVSLLELPGGELIRASFAFAPGDAAAAELHLTLEGEEGVTSETWLYRWTAR